MGKTANDLGSSSPGLGGSAAVLGGNEPCPRKRVRCRGKLGRGRGKGLRGSRKSVSVPGEVLSTWRGVASRSGGALRTSWEASKRTSAFGSRASERGFDVVGTTVDVGGSSFEVLGRVNEIGGSRFQVGGSSDEVLGKRRANMVGAPPLLEEPQPFTHGRLQVGAGFPEVLERDERDDAPVLLRDLSPHDPLVVEEAPVDEVTEPSGRAMRALSIRPRGRFAVTLVRVLCLIRRATCCHAPRHAHRRRRATALPTAALDYASRCPPSLGHVIAMRERSTPPSVYWASPITSDLLRWQHREAMFTSPVSSRPPPASSIRMRQHSG